MNPVVQWLSDGRRLHLQHGPIDLIIEVTASTRSVEQLAFQLAIDRFQTILTELVAELPSLRKPTVVSECEFNGPVARRMWRAASQLNASSAIDYRGQCLQPAEKQPDQCADKLRENRSLKSAAILTATATATVANNDTSAGNDNTINNACAFQFGATTPMIAVAGSVADELLAAITGDASVNTELLKVSVNNGGDIALYLDRAQQYRVGIVANPVAAAIDASMLVDHADSIGGIATSGWHGRSFSLGIADSVTVVAANAAAADVAATLIANAVNIVDPETGLSELSDFVERCPASQLDPDSDLGNTLVTINVNRLPQALVDRALDAGCELARQLEKSHRIIGACLFLQGSFRVTGSACKQVAEQCSGSLSGGAIAGASSGDEGVQVSTLNATRDDVLQSEALQSNVMQSKAPPGKRSNKVPNKASQTITASPIKASQNKAPPIKAPPIKAPPIKAPQKIATQPELS